MLYSAQTVGYHHRNKLTGVLGCVVLACALRCAMQLLVSARAEAESYKAERDELAEVVLEMQDENETLKAAKEAARA